MMAFLSPLTGRARRGSWSNSFLPFTSPKSKPHRKPRRRTSVVEFIFSNFFAVGVSVTVLFFIAVVIRYGIPKPLSSPITPPASRFQKPMKPLHRNPEIPAASVDLTTKDLYDKIEFLDVDGGSWTQGWKVTYEGNEWDSEKLKIFVVPHSHNDPGWKLTVEEYYEKQSRHILDTIVDALSKDSRRRFIWEEMSYLERWWRDAPNSMKKMLIRLVKNGQLEIVGGGWVMNDEANSHYFALIEQITEGNIWLNDTIGVVPKNSWSIDPFGYSPTMAYLVRRMGFENMVIQRTHYELKKELALHKNLEYTWRQSWDGEGTTDMFVHMMPFYSYDVPHTCGPEPSICCQFDFARTPKFAYGPCPWGLYPSETTPRNVAERSAKLLDQYRKKSTLYRTNVLLVPLGDDFRYVTPDEAESQFVNYQKLFDHINSEPGLNAEARFGTLDDYFSALRLRPGDFPSLSGDFFTYADRQHDYWSGYYASRPFFKAVDRVLEHTLRAADIAVSFLLARCQRGNPVCEKLPIGFAHKLTAARRNLALFQHHDGVTGTAKDHVVADYGARMHASLVDLQVFMSKAVEYFLGERRDRSDRSLSQFEPAEVRSEYDVQPRRRVLKTRDGLAHAVVFFNPTERTRDETVSVVVDSADVAVLDSDWRCVAPGPQLSPEMSSASEHRVLWRASIPPLGVRTYHVARGAAPPNCDPPNRAELLFFGEDSAACPPGYSCREGTVAEIRSRRAMVAFDSSTGLLSTVTLPDGTVTVIGEEIATYSSTGSGAYLFKPNGAADPVVRPGGRLVIVDGPLLKEAYSFPRVDTTRSPIAHVTRLYDDDEFFVEKEYRVELTGTEFSDKEIIVRYRTDVDSRRVFHTDLNGFQMSRRETYDKIPIQGNYYPMPSLAFLQDTDGRRFSVHSRQSLGAASLENGWLEVMLDRRLTQDDGRGLGQGVTDNRPMSTVFRLTVEKGAPSTSSALPASPSMASNRVGLHLNHPLHAFVSRKPVEPSVARKKGAPSVPRLFSPLSAPLPCDLHIVSFKVPRPLRYSEDRARGRRFALTLHRRSSDVAYGGPAECADDVPLNLFYMFRGLNVSRVEATSLNLLRDDTEALGYAKSFADAARDGHALIPPMEIQAYTLDFRPQ